MLVIFLYMEVLLFSNQKVPYKACKVSKPTSYKNAQHQNQLRCWATEAPVLFVSINVFGATKGSAFFTMEQSMFASVVVNGVLGPSRLAQRNLTVSLYLCSSGSNAQGESRAQEGRRVSSKSLSRVRDGDEGVAGRNYRE